MKFFSKKFVDQTTVDADGYPVYKRRDDGKVIKKGNDFVHNGFVVPYNKQLLMKYNAHINVEWCNQSRSTKYLFKYINKGHDRITATFYKGAPVQEHNGLVDEIKLYYDCRYLSSCEASWRLFAFHISYKDPSIERLSFHLENEHYVTFCDHERIDNVLDKENSKNSKFLAWTDANKKYPIARELKYNEFPSKFVWNEKNKHWIPRKRGFKIGIYFVHLGSGQLYCLRTLLNYCKGPTSFEDIKTINNVVLKTFKDTCYARGLINDDKELIDVIKEAALWGTSCFLRILFTTLLLSNQMPSLEYIWINTWNYLSDDILYKQRRHLKIPGNFHSHYFFCFIIYNIEFSYYHI